MNIDSFHGIEAFLLKPDIASKNCKILLDKNSSLGPRIKNILGLAQEKCIPVQKVTWKELDNLSAYHKGLVLQTDSELGSGVIDFVSFLNIKRERALVLVLDHIEDPRNFGAILRSSLAFDADLVICPKKRAASLTEAVSRSSAGASAFVPLLFVPNVANALISLGKAGYTRYALDMAGTPLVAVGFSPCTVLVLGGEGKGVSRLVKENCDSTVGIPISTQSQSLNAAIACSIALYEYRRNFLLQETQKQ